MPEIEYVYLPEGEAFDADSLNTRFTTVLDGVNGLVAYSSQRGAFSDQHLASSIIADEEFPSLTQDIGDNSHSYTTVYTTWGGNGVFPGVGDTDRELITGGVGDRLEVILTNPIQLGMHQTDLIAGVLVLLNVNFITAIAVDPELDQHPDLGAMICLQWTPDNVNWFTFRKTERFQWGRTLAAEYSTTVPDLNTSGTMTGPDEDDIRILQDISLRTLILPEDLDDDQTIRGFRAATAVWSPFGVPANAVIQLREANLTLMPLHAGV